MAIITVTSANFEAEVLKADKLVLIDFYADWCGPCKAMTPMLEAFAVENAATVKVVKINVDTSPELADAFNIRSVPTLVTMKDGKGLNGIVGSQPKSTIEKFVALSLQTAAANNIDPKPPAPKGPRP